MQRNATRNGSKIRQTGRTIHVTIRNTEMARRFQTVEHASTMFDRTRDYIESEKDRAVCIRFLQGCGFRFQQLPDTCKRVATMTTANGYTITLDHVRTGERNTFWVIAGNDKVQCDDEGSAFIHYLGAVKHALQSNGIQNPDPLVFG